MSAPAFDLYDEEGNINQSLLDQVEGHVNQGAILDCADSSIYTMALGFRIADLLMAMTLGIPSHNGFFSAENPRKLYA